MNIFISREEEELGPLTWVDVSLLLDRGEIDLDTLARMGDESKTLTEWGLWNEGAEVGPLDWDEVSTLLQAGIVDLNVPAKFEGPGKFSRLADVIHRSREICIDSPKSGQWSLLSKLWPFSVAGGGWRPGTLAACAGMALVLAGASIFLIFASRPAVPTRIATVRAVTQPDLPVSLPFPEEARAVSPPAAVGPEMPKEPQRAASEDSQPATASGASPAVAKAALEDTADNIAQSGQTAEAVKTSEAPAEAPLAANTAPPPLPEQNHKAPEPAAPVQHLPAPASAPLPARPVQTVSASRPSPTPEAAAPFVGNFFEIQSVKLLKKAPKDGFGVWLFSNDKNKVPIEFQPCLEVKATAKDNIRSENLTARAYFYDENNKLVSSLTTPSKAGSQEKGRHHEMPVLFYKDKADRFFFEVPAKIRDSRWKAVVVFGDKSEARSACFPPTESDYLLNYPEKELVYNRNAQRVVRKAAMDPLIEHVVKTRNPKMPQITLFLRPPKGISDATEVQGVMAICVLANSLEEMQRDLRKEEMPGDYAGLFSFANKNKLAIVAWGSRRLWDPGRNYDDLPRETARNIDESLDIVMNAWERGIKELGDKYGIPQKDFLLWGNCGSAQWAQRLCLRKPQYFLATHIHMPGSYDKPTPEAANVLWCLTIGELEGGYERSKRWVKTVREMGYPIVYKAIPGLGHSGHPNAAALGFEFYKFALEQKKAREESQKDNPNSAPSLVNKIDTPWSELFQNPPYYGDMVNQELYPSTEVTMIPAGFRISLPSKQLADIWIRNK